MKLSIHFAGLLMLGCHVQHSGASNVRGAADERNLWGDVVGVPTAVPTPSPSDVPTFAPSLSPTRRPSESPSDSPTESPSDSPSESPTAEPRIVVIDAGHGGNVKVGGSAPNHAEGPTGLLEKAIALQVAQKLRDELEEFPNVIVKMTRDADVNLGLAARAGVAKQWKADVFLSIHFNGMDDRTIQGTETWVYPGAIGKSVNLAAQVQESAVSATGYRNRGVKNDKNLGVLDPKSHYAETASCLLELSFMTGPSNNPGTTDEQRLKQPEYIDFVAKKIAAGIVKYLKDN